MPQKEKAPGGSSQGPKSKENLCSNNTDKPPDCQDNYVLSDIDQLFIETGGDPKDLAQPVKKHPTVKEDIQRKVELRKNWIEANDPKKKSDDRVRDVESSQYPGYLTYRLFVSDAYRHLKPAAKDILIQFFFEYKLKGKKKSYAGKKGREGVTTVINAENIILPYRHITERLGYSDKTIWDSIRQFLAHGFLKVIKYGGGRKGDYQVFGVCEDWQDWQPGQVIRPLRPKGKVGFQKKISSTVGKAPTQYCR